MNAGKIPENLDYLEEIRSSVRKLLDKELTPHVEATERDKKFCHSAFLKLGEAGMVAPMLPEPYGMDDVLAQLIVAEEMGANCAGFGLSALASVCLFGANIARHGTDEQKKKYLPGIANGQKIGCWALTEPGVGSNALGVKTKCLKKGDHYILNGSKTFITNGPIADYFIIICRESGTGIEGGTMLVLERGMKGLKTGQPFDKMGHQSSPTGEVFMENMEVPASHVLGKPGKGFQAMMHSLDIERIVFSGIGMGMMEDCLKVAVNYASERKQFDVPLIEHQMIQDKIAQMATDTSVFRTYLYEVAKRIIRGETLTKEAAMVKLAGAELLMKTADHAVQILGGYGYMKEYRVERHLRDAKLFEIGAGTNEIQKILIAKQVIKEFNGIR